MTIDTTTTTITTSDDTTEGLAALIRALPLDTDIEAWATERGLVVRPEGIVPRGAAWQVHDEAGVNGVPDIDVARDPDEDDYNGDWLVDIEETVVLYARWSLVVVDWDGDTDTVWVTTRTVVDPAEPDCDAASSHEWTMLSARGDGAGVRTVDVCACGCHRTTRTRASDSMGKPFTRVSYE